MNSFSFGKKYPAFTLTELLVGMILSGIVISTVWTAFHVVSKLAQSSIASEAQVEEISFFKRCFTTEFESAQRVTRNEDGFTFSSDNPEHDVNYIFIQESVVRKCEGKTDTFHVQIAGVSAKSGDVESTEGIDKMKCAILINGMKEELFVNRTLSSRDLMKSDD